MKLLNIKARDLRVGDTLYYSVPKYGNDHKITRLELCGNKILIHIEKCPHPIGLFVHNGIMIHSQRGPE